MMKKKFKIINSIKKINQNFIKILINMYLYIKFIFIPMAIKLI